MQKNTNEANRQDVEV